MRRATRPLLPTPVARILPRRVWRVSTARGKVSSSRAASCSSARASASRMLRPNASLDVSASMRLLEVSAHARRGPVADKARAEVLRAVARQHLRPQSARLEEVLERLARRTLAAGALAPPRAHLV